MLAACPSLAVAASLACGGGVSPSCVRATLAGKGRVDWQGIARACRSRSPAGTADTSFARQRGATRRSLRASCPEKTGKNKFAHGMCVFVCDALTLSRPRGACRATYAAISLRLRSTKVGLLRVVRDGHVLADSTSWFFEHERFPRDSSRRWHCASQPRPQVFFVFLI